jgi:hypothetical protein
MQRDLETLISRIE